MRSVTDSEAQGLLEELLDCVEQGESITITRHGLPVAVLAPTPEWKKRDGLKAVEEWEAYRKLHNITLGPDLTIRQLIDEGRKY